MPLFTLTYIITIILDGKTQGREYEEIQLPQLITSLYMN